VIHVDFDPSALSDAEKAEWDTWQDEADEATKEIIQKWESSRQLSSDDFKRETWSDLKAWLLEHVFNKKCAYCETNVREARQVGHAEHFRPKGGVKYKEEGKDKQTTARVKDEQGQDIDHPGYFWLAYNWKNLVPSCEACNTRWGKKNQFPVEKHHVLLQKLTDAQVQQLKAAPTESPSWSGFFYLQPDDLDRIEGRLLLHPYYDDPSQHLCFGHGGEVFARELESGESSPQGKHSISTYDLDDGDLARARHTVQDTAWMRFKLARDYHEDIQGLDPEEALEKAREDIPRFVMETTEYRAAALDYIDLRCKIGY
jgi:hypothetical protein